MAYILTARTGFFRILLERFTIRLAYEEGF